MQISKLLTAYYRAIQIYSILFQYFSQKRKALECIVELRCHDKRKRKVLIGICKKRWFEKNTSYEYFYLPISPMAEASKAIIDCPVLTDFGFISSIVTLYRVIYSIAPVTQKLHDWGVHVIKKSKYVHCTPWVFKANRLKMSTQLFANKQKEQQQA